MIRTQVSLDKAMYQAARLEAKKLGISFAELCRRALARVLAEKHADRPWMRFAGMLASGDPDSSRTVDEIVYGRPEP